MINPIVFQPLIQTSTLIYSEISSHKKDLYCEENQIDKPVDEGFIYNITISY